MCGAVAKTYWLCLILFTLFNPSANDSVLYLWRSTANLGVWYNDGGIDLEVLADLNSPVVIFSLDTPRFTYVMTMAVILPSLSVCVWINVHLRTNVTQSNFSYVSTVCYFIIKHRTVFEPEIWIRMYDLLRKKTIIWTVICIYFNVIWPVLLKKMN